MIGRILITGSREWTDEARIEKWLRWEYSKYPPELVPVLVHGACRGADLIADEIWRAHGLPVEAHPADWDQFGKRAGMIRNTEMIRLGADVCIAFLLPDSRGTVHCANAAEAAGITTKRVFGNK